MPRCYPPDPDWPADRHGERAVFEALRNQLPEECALFSSVGLTERGEEREIDILVAWPGHGIAVIEVKGGTVSCEQRQWWQSSGTQKHKIQNPITQAQDGKHMLLRFLSRFSTVLPKVRAAHLVAFPYTKCRQGLAGSGLPPRHGHRTRRAEVRGRHRSGLDRQ